MVRERGRTGNALLGEGVGDGGGDGAVVLSDFRVKPRVAGPVVEPDCHDGHHHSVRRSAYGAVLLTEPVGEHLHEGCALDGQGTEEEREARAVAHPAMEPPEDLPSTEQHGDEEPEQNDWRGNEGEHQDEIKGLRLLHVRRQIGGGRSRTEKEIELPVPVQETEDGIEHSAAENDAGEQNALRSLHRARGEEALAVDGVRRHSAQPVDADTEANTKTAQDREHDGNLDEVEDEQKQFSHGCGDGREIIEQFQHGDSPSVCFLLGGLSAKKATHDRTVKQLFSKSIVIISYFNTKVNRW